MAEFSDVELVKQLRRRAHLSQEQLARLYGVTQRTVQRWEAGRYPLGPWLGSALRAMIKLPDARLEHIAYHNDLSGDAIAVGTFAHLVAEGMSLSRPAAELAPIRNVDPELEQLIQPARLVMKRGGRRMSAEEARARPLEPLEVKCPQCGARAHVGCKDYKKRGCAPHAKRARLARAGAHAAAAKRRQPAAKRQKSRRAPARKKGGRRS